MREKILNYLDTDPVIAKLLRYYDSLWYPVTIAALTFFGFVTALDLYTMLLTAAVGCVGMAIARDLRYAVAPTLMVVFQMSNAHSPHAFAWVSEAEHPGGAYFQGGAPFYCVIAALVIIAAVFLFHCWLRGTLVRIFTKKTKLLFWSIPMMAALALNGIFAEGYTVKNLAFGVATAVLWVVVYLVYYHGLENRKDTLRYMMWCCITALIVILAELTWHYILHWREIFGPEELRKSAVVLGWGIHNNVAGMIAMLIPACFYMATQYRHGWLFWLLGAVSYGGIILTYSRSAILVGGVVLLASLIGVCLIGEHKRLYRILFASVGGAVVFVYGLIGILASSSHSILWREIMHGFDSSGRLPLWEHALKHTLMSPAFGIGFYNIDFTSWSAVGIPGFLHNTFVQLLASCGVFGLVSYLVYRGRTIWLMVKRPTVARLFLALGVAALLGTSLFDNNIFNIYPSFYYALFLALAEQDLDNRLVCEE